MYAKIFTQIFDSSIADNYELRHFFMDLIVLADVNGVVDATPSAIAARTRIPLEKVQLFLGQLEAEDAESRTPDEGGARIRKLDTHRTWGWEIINYEKFRAIASEEQRREKTKMRTRKWREIKGAANSVTLGDAPKRERDDFTSPSPSSSACTGIGVQREGGPEPHYPEIPDFPSVKLEAAKIGLPEWRAFDWFNEMESSGWRYKGEQVRNWRAFLVRLRTWWESDGRPKDRPVRGQNQQKPKSVFELRTILEAKERQMQELRRVHCSEAAMGESWDSTESKTQYRNLRSEVKALTARIAAS